MAPRKKRTPKLSESKPASSLDAMLANLDGVWEEARSNDLSVSPMDRQPGIYLDIPFEDYVCIPAVNYSNLRILKQSPAHYRYRPPVEPSPFLRLGTLVHEGHLEPDLLVSKYIVVPENEIIRQIQVARRSAGQEEAKVPRATKHFKDAVKAYMANHPGKQRITVEDFNKLGNILRSLRAHKIASSLFREGFPEVTVIWDDEGLLCKCRVDWLPTLDPFGLSDLKTSWDTIDWNLSKFDYYLQAAFYTRGYMKAYKALKPSQQRKWPRPTPLPLVNNGKTYPYYFVVVETSPPFCTRVAPVSVTSILDGQQELNFLLDLLHDCIERKKWPGPKDPKAWGMSRWYKTMDFPSHQDYPEGVK